MEEGSKGRGEKEASTFLEFWGGEKGRGGGEGESAAERTSSSSFLQFSSFERARKKKGEEVVALKRGDASICLSSVKSRGEGSPRSSRDEKKKGREILEIRDAGRKSVPASTERVSGSEEKKQYRRRFPAE